MIGIIGYSYLLVINTICAYFNIGISRDIGWFMSGFSFVMLIWMLRDFIDNKSAVLSNQKEGE